MKKFKVISSNPSNEGKTFVTKLQRDTLVSTAFGDKRKQETYYVSGSKQVAVGSEVELDTTEWNVVERPFELNGETILCKWLHLGDVAPKVTITSAKELASV